METITKDTLIVKCSSLKSITDALYCENSRGFYDLEKENKIIEQINKILSTKEELSNKLFFNSNLNNISIGNKYTLCHKKLLEEALILLRERQEEYIHAIHLINAMEKPRLVIDFKNMRDKFTSIASHVSIMLREHENKYARYEELKNKLQLHKKIYLEIEHSYSLYNKNKIILELPSSAIMCENDEIKIGKPFSDFSATSGIYLKFSLHDIKSIGKNNLSNALTLSFHSSLELSLIFPSIDTNEPTSN